MKHHRRLCGQGGVGMYRRVEYRAWWNMVARCTDQKDINWNRYGARGITVCQEWRESFEAFYAAIGPRPSRDHSLGRIEAYGNYQPGNVAWQTREEQGRIHRESRGRIRIAVYGIVRSIAQWARHSGLPYWVLYRRLTRGGWKPAIAVTTSHCSLPVQPERKTA